MCVQDMRIISRLSLRTISGAIPASGVFGPIDMRLMYMMSFNNNGGTANLYWGGVQDNDHIVPRSAEIVSPAIGVLIFTRETLGAVAQMGVYVMGDPFDTFNIVMHEMDADTFGIINLPLWAPIGPMR